MRHKKITYTICMILCFLSFFSYGLEDPETIYVEGASLFDKHTGTYQKTAPLPGSNDPTYTYGDFVVYRENQYWQLKDSNNIIYGRSVNDFALKPWHGNFTGGVKIFLDKMFRWGNTHTISFLYSDMDTAKTYKLKVGETPLFQQYGSFTDMDVFSKESIWYLYPVDNKAGYYYILHISSREYIIIDEDKNVKLEEDDCEVWRLNCNPSVGEEAHWRFEAFNHHDDILIINKTDNIERVLKVRRPTQTSDTPPNEYAVDAIEITGEPGLSREILFRMDNNFT